MTKSKKRRLPESSAGGTSSSSDVVVEGDAPPLTSTTTPIKVVADDRRDDDRVTWSKSKKKRMRKREAARRQSTAVAEDDGGRGGGGRTNGPSSDRDDGGPPDEKDDDGVVRDGRVTATGGIGGEPSESRVEESVDDDDGRNGKKKRQRKEKDPPDDDPKPQSSVASKSGGRSAPTDDGGGGPKKEGKTMRSARDEGDDDDDDDDVTRRSTSTSGPEGAAEYDDAVRNSASKSGDAESPEGRSIDVDRAAATTDEIGGDKKKKKKKKKKKNKNIDDDSGEPKRDGQDPSARPSTRRDDDDDAVQESASKSGKEDVLESPKKRSSDVNGVAARTDEVCGSASKKKKKKKTKKNKEGNGASTPPTTSGPKDPTSVEGRCDAKARDEADDDNNLGRGESPISPKVKISLPKPSQMSTLQRDFLERLTSSRFRELNEDLYTQPSDLSFERFTSQPELFDQYHVGFRKQAKSWPVNPVDVIYKKIVGGWTRERQEEGAGGGGRRSGEGGGKREGKKTVIADFGCGDAKLAEKLLALRIGKDGKSLAQASTKDKERQLASCPFEVFSFDLVSGGNPLVTPADMSDVPLPDEAVDVAVYSLALMGTNVADFVREAWRVLRFNGVLRVAEVRSRFETAAGGPDDMDETATNKRGKSNNGKWHHPSKSGGHRAKRNAPDDDGDGAPPRHLMLLDEFLSLMERCGFQCTYMDRSNKMFLFMDFVKLDGSTGLSDKERFTAKACIYKKR